MIYKNRGKTTVLLFAILLLSSCAGKKDFTKGVLEEDKKLLSSKTDKVLSEYDDILITRNGFYPKKNNKYYKRVTNYSKLMKLNLKKFIDDIKKYNLQDFKNKTLLIKKEFPSLDTRKLTKKDINSFANLSLYEKQKIVVYIHPSYLSKVSNPSKELKKIALKGKERDCDKLDHHYWMDGSCHYRDPNPGEPSNSSHSSSYSSSSSGGSYSSQSCIKVSRLRCTYIGGRTCIEVIECY